MGELDALTTDCRSSSIGKGLKELSRILSLVAMYVNAKSITPHFLSD